mgnify:CR=1 FL=1
MVGTPSAVRTSRVRVVAAASGCKQKPAPPFTFDILVESDPGEPLAGASVAIDNKEFAVTRADGKIRLEIMGNEGETRELAVKCPEGHEQPKAVTLSLRRLVGNVPEHKIGCAPLLRKLVIAVRAENGIGLPVKFLGQEQARTDGSGAAHVVVMGRPGEQIEVLIDASDAKEKLIPKQESRPFVIQPHDDIVYFDRSFAIERKPLPRRIGPVKVGPRRI